MISVARRRSVLKQTSMAASLTALPTPGSRWLQIGIQYRETPLPPEACEIA